MKKTFCDCCGKEFEFQNNPGMFAFTGGPKLVSLNSIKFEVEIRVKAVDKKNGEHVDVCEGCRWHLVSLLDHRL